MFGFVNKKGVASICAMVCSAVMFVSGAVTADALAPEFSDKFEEINPTFEDMYVSSATKNRKSPYNKDYLVVVEDSKATIKDVLEACTDNYVASLYGPDKHYSMHRVITFNNDDSADVFGCIVIDKKRIYFKALVTEESKGKHTGWMVLSNNKELTTHAKKIASDREVAMHV